MKRIIAVILRLKSEETGDGARGKGRKYSISGYDTESESVTGRNKWAARLRGIRGEDDQEKGE